MVGDARSMTTKRQVTGIEAAHRVATRRLAEDMPLLQHGSGDVPPQFTNPATTTVLAALTARYVSNLVDAAIDARNVLCGGNGGVYDVDYNNGTLKNGMPKRTGLPPPVFAAAKPIKQERRTVSSVGTKKRRRRADEEYWDEPVVPKIRKQKSTKNHGNVRDGAGGVHDDDDDDDNDAFAAAMRWVGAAGGGDADAFPESSRVRATYVRGPSALGPQNFVFPVCHDTYAYNRVREIQAAKRSLEPLLMVDPTLADLVRTEGRPLKKKGKAISNNKKRSGASSDAAAAAAAKSAGTQGTGGDDNADADDDDPDDDLAEEEDESDSADDGPVWPGLASILPVHRRRQT